MKDLLRVGLATIAGVMVLGDGAIAGVRPLEELDVGAIELSQANEAAEFGRLFAEGREFFNLRTAQGYRNAIKSLESALVIAKRTQNEANIAAVSSWLGFVHDCLGDRRSALEHYQVALAGFRATGDRAGEATTLTNIGAVYSSLGNKSEALRYYEQALPIRREVGDRAGEAITLNNIGMVYSSLGNKSEALRYYEQALPISREVGDRAGEAITLNNIGMVYSSLGNKSEALRYYEQALPISREVGDRAGEATTLNNIGAVYSDLGKQSEALRYYEQALPISREVGDRAGEARTLTNIGAVYSSLGNKSEALRYYEQALPIRREVGDRAGEATTLNNIGLVYSSLGNQSEALRYYEQALPILREVGDRAGEATTLNNIGWVYSALGNQSEALRYYEQALPIHREVGDRAGEATTLNNIGAVYDDLGNKSEALRYLEQALPISREVGDRAGEAVTLNNIGAVYDDLGNKSEALRYYEQALPISREVGDRAGEANTLWNIADTYRDQNDLPTALTNIETAIAIVEQLRSEITSTDLRTSYFATVQGYYQLQIDLLMQLHQQHPETGYDTRAFNASERTRARTLIELLAEANLEITENVDPALQQQERDLRQQLQSLDAERVARLQAVTDSSQIEAIVENFDRQTTATLRQLDTLASQLRQTNPAYAALQYPEPLELPGVQQQVLDPDTTLLQYSLGDDRSYLWVVTADSFETFTLPGREEIDTAARELYAELGKNGMQPVVRAKATALSELILAPVADRLSTDRLLIVPDGTLHQIPFSAIANPNADSYEPLLVQHEIVSAPSSTVIATNRETMGDRAPAPNRLAVVADPVFTADDPRLTGQPATDPIDPDGVRDLERALRDFDLRNIARLPNTKTEGDRLLALADGGETAVFDFDADRPWVAGNSAKQYQYVHFATHGFANSENPELSGLVLSLLDENGEPQNGFLRLADIFNLQLPAEMVVLSACQTGLGETVGGEGMVGLTRGLMYAGAERTVLSLWNVNDEKTADLMVRFYTGIWEDGLTPAAALRQAQLEMWNAGDHPYFWAAFGLQGEWRN